MFWELKLEKDYQDKYTPSLKRILKVVVRSIHLVGAAGTFGNAMTYTPSSIYITIAIISGILLTILEASDWVWFVQLRGIAIYLKLLAIWIMHIYPNTAVPAMIFAILISGFFSHAPSTIRYYSIVHKKVLYCHRNILG
jgi:hypothetical protein